MMKKAFGFTLIEAVVCVAIFSVLILAISGFFTSVIKGITYYRERVVISSLANQYLEIARNLPYAQIGTENGNPHGTLPDLPSPLEVSFNGANYQIYYVVNALHDLADPNIGVQDYKQVKLYIKNVSTGAENSFVTTIAPIKLASLGSGGVISFQVINKAWQPVPEALIHITNANIVPNINLYRTAGSDGKWNEIGLAPDSNYHVVVTKNGYSADQTYPATQYPGATNLDVTVIQGEATSATFAIDPLSNLVFNVKSRTCQPISGVATNVRGAKTISPGFPKFDKAYTSNAGGQIYPQSASTCSSNCGAESCCLEWDVYALTLAGETYMVYGTSPAQVADLMPNTSQSFNLMLGPKTANSASVVVKDVSGNPVEGAKVELSNAGLDYDAVKYTGGSVWNQNDWSGGSGQADWSTSDGYYQDENISNNAIPLALRLAPGSAPYQASGFLVSSIFDTGTDQTHYASFTWGATTEEQVTGVKFQIAASNTNDENTVWNFNGPDGTAGTFYEISGTAINSENNNMRYVRYKAYLTTTDPQKTPMLSSVSINYVSGCPTPGQVMFSGLTADEDYTITVNDDPDYMLNNVNINGYFISQITLQ